MSWLAALSLANNHMPPMTISEDTVSKQFDDFLADINDSSSNLPSKSVSEEILLDGNNNDSNNNGNNNNNVSVTDNEMELLKAAVFKLQASVSDLNLTNSIYRTQISDLQKDRDELYDSIYYLERDLSQFMQYNRRENIELVGLPDNIPDNHLEEVVVDILKRIGVTNLSHYDIIGCHRLKNRKLEASNVIVRFINRKHAKETLANKKNLSYLPEYKNVYIIENLCPRYKAIYDNCMGLKKKNLISHLWTFNGTIFIKKSDNRNEKPKRILHVSDLEYFFPNYIVK